MANSASIRTDLRTLMQDALSEDLRSTLFNHMPTLGFILSRTGDKDGFKGLGVPRSGEVFSGMGLSKPKKTSIVNSDKYMPIIEVVAAAEADGKVMGMRDTMPSHSNWTTTSIGSAFTRPFVKWVERADPIQVPKKEIRRTIRGGGSNASVAVGDLFAAETKRRLASHMKWWNTQLWSTTAYPSNEDAEVWDNIHGLSSAIDTDNSYCGVDRTISANSYWRGNRVTTATAAVLEDIVNYSQYTLGIADKGVGIQLVVVGNTLFPIFKAEAKAKGGTVFYKDIPDIGEFGFKREVVKFNNTYVLCDPACPSVQKGDTYNVVCVLNPDTWTVAVSPQANFSVDEPFDLSKTDGGKDAMKSNLRTELMLICEVPSLNVYYENVA